MRKFTIAVMMGLASLVVLSGCAQTVPNTLPTPHVADTKVCRDYVVEYRTGSRIKQVQNRVHRRQCSEDLAAL